MDTATIKTPLRQDAVLEELLIAAQREQDERRNRERLPLFHAVFICTEDGHTHTAFTRDVSKTGIGLLHRLPIEPQTISILLRCASGGMFRVRLEITWCNSCGEGWYVSGGGFRDAEVCR